MAWMGTTHPRNHIHWLHNSVTMCIAWCMLNVTGNHPPGITRRELAVSYSKLGLYRWATGNNENTFSIHNRFRTLFGGYLLISRKHSVKSSHSFNDSFLRVYDPIAFKWDCPYRDDMYNHQGPGLFFHLLQQIWQNRRSMLNPMKWLPSVGSPILL